jgi:hypothetical protein
MKSGRTLAGAAGIVGESTLPHPDRFRTAAGIVKGPGHFV